MTKRGLLSFRHAEMFWHTKEKCRNTKRSWEFLTFSWLCHNFYKYLKLNRPRIRSLPIIFGTWLSSFRPPKLTSQIAGFESTFSNASQTFQMVANFTTWSEESCMNHFHFENTSRTVADRWRCLPKCEHEIYLFRRTSGKTDFQWIFYYKSSCLVLQSH